MLAGHANRATIPEYVDDDDTLISDDLGIMPGRDIEYVAWPKVGGLAAVPLDVETAFEQHLEVMDLARGRALDGP